MDLFAVAGWAAYALGIWVAVACWDVSSLFMVQSPIAAAAARKGGGWRTFVYRGLLVVVVVMSATVPWRLTGVWWAGLIGFAGTWYGLTRLLAWPARLWVAANAELCAEFFRLRVWAIGAAWLLMQSADFLGSLR